jgi:hypothetical protein
MSQRLQLSTLVAVVLAMAGSAAGQRAQTPPNAPTGRPSAAAAGQKPRAPGDVEVAPIACWWKTDKSAVLIGERFTVTLTCSIVETNAVKVIPDLNQLEPTTVALAPFEVVKGIRHEDIRTPPWRYIQYEYTTRLVGDVFFGKDVDIPGVKITYHIQSSIGGASQGRDQTYGLPALTMRVNSLVPKKVADIRDTSADTFADIEARRFRSTFELVAAAICFGFALVLIGLALVRVVGRYRVRTPLAARPLPVGFVLGGSVRAAGRVQADVLRDGWTPDLIGRALTLFRIASAVALGRPITQSIVGTHAAGHEGVLALRKGIFRPKHVMVSTSTTPGTISSALANVTGEGIVPSARMQLLLADLGESLRVLGIARYGRNGQPDTAALDTALESGTNALRKLRAATRWPMRMAAALSRSVADVGGMVWSR